MTGTIFDIKEMAVHDGPGIRTSVFLKGCPLRCVWCHNPEGLSSKTQLMHKYTRCKDCGLCRKPCNHDFCKPFGRCVRICPEKCLEIVGKEVDANVLASELQESALVLGESFGGFTFTGGEPFAQPDFLLELIHLLEGYHLCIETSGYTDAETFRKVIEKLDYVIMDIKIADNRVHRKFTGVSNERILENLEILRKSGKPCCIRTPLIPGITDTVENLAQIKALVGDLEHECLAYNPIGEAKYKMLGFTYPLEDFS